jgi:alginate O-acetyltransferase complex protein AlgI
MLFQSLSFIFVFFPFTLAAFLLLNKRLPNSAAVFLIAASLVFCGYNDLRAAMVIVGSAFFNYLAALIIEKTKPGSVYKTLCLVIGICLNFLVLFWYKFFSASIQDSLIRNESIVNTMLEVSIPLGLSFYTLYQISLLVDIYQKKAKRYNFRSYLLSLTMFAHLPAGPILRYKTSIQQFSEVGRKSISEENIVLGLSLFTFGLFKKTLLADPLSIFTDQMFASINLGASFTTLESLFTVWGFLLQLYFDFSAYSDMAIGLGLCFGLKFPVNFNSPLKAISFTDYVGRWHISLIAFNREYIFLPVSKLMLKLLKGVPTYKYYLSGIIATMVVYISIGFWHSPTLQFLFSGVLIGLILTMSQIILLIFGKTFHLKFRMNRHFKKIGTILNQFKVLLVAGIAGSLLRLNDLSAFKSLLEGFGNFKINNYSPWFYLNQPIGNHDFFSMIENPIYLFSYKSLSLPFPFFILICSVLALRGPNSMEIFGLRAHSNEKWNKYLLWKPTLFWGVIMGFLIALYLVTRVGNHASNDFIYGQF